MESKIISTITTILKSKAVQDYIAAAESIHPGEGYPFVNYFGVNYRGDEVLNVKIYFSFFRRLKEEDIKKLIPNTEVFLKHYDKWLDAKTHDMQHTGCTFALKVTADLKPTYYFHYRLPGAAGKLPKNISLNQLEQNEHNNTISYEFNDDKVLEKNYYLLFDKTTVKNCLEKYKIDFLIKQNYLPDLIEYTETEKWDKIILAIADKDMQKKYMNSLPEKNMNQVINYFCNKYQLMTASSSIYNDLKTRAVYFLDDMPSVYLTNSNTIFRLKNTLFKGIL